MRLKLCKPYINGFRDVGLDILEFVPWHNSSRIKLQWVGTRVSTP